jgi:hypothetical protein
MIVLWSAGDHDIRGMQPSSDVSVKARRWMMMQARALERATPHSREGQTRKNFCKKSLVSPAKAFAGR